MARKAAAKAVEIKEEVKAVEAVAVTAVEETVTETPVEVAPVEAAPVKEAPKKKSSTKSAAKKAEAKKPAAKKTAEKKTASKKAAEKKTAPKTNLFIQYQGVELSYADLIERVKADSGIDSPKSVNLYVKPEDNMVYYVVNENEKVGGFVIA
jgi:septal ring-binding cell division protein DamX